MSGAALVVAGGSGDASDVAAVRAAAAKLPEPVATLFKAKGISIVACRNSVTDFETSLKGRKPRGWPPELKRTWDSVPGTFLDTRACVVIATVAAAGGRQVTPRSPTTHGAFDLTLHESMHGYDYVLKHKVLEDARFVAARDADYEALTSYESQKGQAGLEETYAESAARYFGSDPTLAANWPHLRDFWRVAFSEAPSEPPVKLPRKRGKAALGTARMTEDRVIILDLRAEGPGGAIGHASLAFKPDDEVHAKLARQIARRGEGLDGEMLFYGFEE